MSCKPVSLPGGGFALVRMGPAKPRTCSVCRRSTREYKLCDYGVGMRAGKSKTCDAVLCSACAAHRDPDTDYCPLHARAVEGKLKL